jgi:predicted nucleic acid-binding protein
MKQVMYDTQAVVKGLICPQDPYPALFRLPAGWKLCLSDLILREALEILLGNATLASRLPALKDIPLAEAYRQVVNGDIYPVPEEVEIEICRDPADNKYLASALALDCDYLVTEVEDLLGLSGNDQWTSFKEQNSVRVEIVDPVRFAQLLTRGANGGGDGQ